MTKDAEMFLADAKPIGVAGFSCDHCGKDLKPEDKVLACSDCGALFCEDCVRAGAFDDHECEDEDE